MTDLVVIIWERCHPILRRKDVVSMEVSMAMLQTTSVKGTVILIQSGGFADQGHDLNKATVYFQNTYSRQEPTEKRATFCDTMM